MSPSIRLKLVSIIQNAATDRSVTTHSLPNKLRKLETFPSSSLRRSSTTATDAPQYPTS